MSASKIVGHASTILIFGHLYCHNNIMLSLVRYELETFDGIINFCMRKKLKLQKLKHSKFCMNLNLTTRVDHWYSFTSVFERPTKSPVSTCVVRL